MMSQKNTGTKKTTQLITASKPIKYLGINLTKDIHSEKLPNNVKRKTFTFMFQKDLI